MTRALIVGVLTLLVGGVGTDAFAQGARNSPQPRAGRGGGPLTPAEVVRLLDAWAVGRAQKALELTDAQYGPFVTRLKQLQDTRRRNQQARNRVLQALRQLTRADAPRPADDAGIKERLRALREHDDRSAAELRRAYDALDEVVDTAQQARFRIFEETIERRKLDLLMRARQAARRGGT